MGSTDNLMQDTQTSGGSTRPSKTRQSGNGKIALHNSFQSRQGYLCGNAKSLRTRCRVFREVHLQGSFFSYFKGAKRLFENMCRPKLSRPFVRLLDGLVWSL